MQHCTSGLAARVLAGLQQPRILRHARLFSSNYPRTGGVGSFGGQPGGAGGDSGGSGPRELKAFALPHWRMARKSEAELGEAAAEDGQSSGPRFPFKDEFEISRECLISGQQVVDTLSPLMTQERVERIEQVCTARTFNVLPICENIYDLGNLAAICRSADALGFGAVHVIRNLRDERYKQSKRSSAGADKWLDVQVFDSTEDCLRRAKRMGYQIVVTHLSEGAVDISQIDWTRPTAFVMGNEEKGVSAEAMALADACAVVPMVGFVDSFNISVAAALIMYEARRCREQHLGAHGDLSPEEQALLKAVFFLRNKGQTREYIQHMLERPPPQWQAHRGSGDWGGKAFSTAGASSNSTSEGQEAAGSGTELSGQQLYKSACHYWDGRCCWGERYLWPSKPCRYSPSHHAGVSTFNKEKLRQMCEQKGLAFPQDLSSPPPLPPDLLTRRQAEVEAAVAAADAAAEAATGSREAHELLLAAAAEGATAAS